MMVWRALARFPIAQRRIRILLDGPLSWAATEALLALSTGPRYRARPDSVVQVSHPRRPAR